MILRKFFVYFFLLIIAGATNPNLTLALYTNIALSGQASQSSTGTYEGITGYATRANDGNTDGTWVHYSVSHTNYNTNAWWRVELNGVFEIDHIIIWNRNDSNRMSERLTNFTVSVLNSSMTTVFSKVFFTDGGTFYSDLRIELPEGILGKYVQVQLNGTNYLHLAEVQVLGSSSKSAYLSDADFDKDGDVDASDLAKFSSVYGTFINKTPTNTSWSWDNLPTGYFCDNWENGECTVKRPDYSLTSARISELKQGIVQPENGTIDETFINASESGAFKFTTEEIVISNLFDSTWHDVLGKNNSFNTVWYPNFPIEKLEVISQVDKRSAPSSTTNNKSYFFSYKQNNISLTDWIDYLKSISCNFSRKIDTLVIYAHGGYINNEGLLEITGDILHTNDLQNDNDIRNTLIRLKNIMTPNGHILLFSCNTGQDQAFIKELASLSGTFVHANSNLTGHPDDEAPWFNCASNSECTDWQLDLVCPPTGDCYYE